MADSATAASDSYTQIIATRDLGLAGYVGMLVEDAVAAGDSSAEFLGCDEGVFRFRYNRSMRDLQVEYMNHIVHRHDVKVINYRKLLPRRRRNGNA